MGVGGDTIVCITASRRECVGKERWMLGSGIPEWDICVCVFICAFFLVIKECCCFLCVCGYLGSLLFFCVFAFFVV